MSRPKQKRPPLTHEQAAAEREADERDAEAIHRFFTHVLGGALKPSCSRLGSSQQTNRKKKPRRSK